MNTHSTPNQQIRFLEIVDDFIIYAIGSQVFQIEVTAEDLEWLFGTETLDWESSIGHHYADEVTIVESLKEVQVCDYMRVITSLMAKAEDVTDSYEGPITETELEICRIAGMSNQEDVKRALWSLMLTTRELQNEFSK